MRTMRASQGGDTFNDDDNDNDWKWCSGRCSGLQCAQVQMTFPSWNTPTHSTSSWNKPTAQLVKTLCVMMMIVMISMMITMMTM